jgi:anaerobic selenocysteine-containing dehydrogenase
MSDNDPYVQMHPADAEALFLTNGQPVIVQSTRGTARTHLRVDNHISPGTVFMPMHWNELYGESISCNESTSDARDPISKQPSLKYCAVRVSAEVVRPKLEADAKKEESPAKTEPAARL